MNLNNQIDWSDTDRIVSNDTRYVALNGDWWRESSSWQTRKNGSSELTLMGRSRTRLTGLASNGEYPSTAQRSPEGAATRGAESFPLVQNGSVLISETHSLDPLNNETVSCTYLDRTTHTTTRTTTTPASPLPAEVVVQSGLTVSTRTHTGVTTTYAYDALGRQISQTDGRGNTSQIVYDAQGRVTRTVDALGAATAYTYDALGRQTSVTDPNGMTVTTAYDAEGHVISQRGATYPVDYTYDEFGNKVAMMCYRGRGTGNGEWGRGNGDITRWFYDEATGLVTNKVYADGKGPSYTYTPDGKLATRTWARGVVTTYTYDNSGALTNTVYSDGTPTVSMAYDRTAISSRRIWYNTRQ